MIVLIPAYKPGQSLLDLVGQLTPRYSTSSASWW